MTREDLFIEWFVDTLPKAKEMKKHLNPIIENLTKADNEGSLTDVLLNSRKHKWALVAALNMYGMDNPGFAGRIYDAFINALDAPSKKAVDLMFSLKIQAELQQKNISFIDFVDENLHLQYIKKSKKRKVWNILLYIFLIYAFTFIYGASILSGMLVLFPFSGVAMIISLVGLIRAFSIPRRKFKPEAYKPIKDYSDMP